MMITKSAVALIIMQIFVIICMMLFVLIIAYPYNNQKQKSSSLLIGGEIDHSSSNVQHVDNYFDIISLQNDNKNSRLLQQEPPTSDEWYLARIGDVNVVFTDGDDNGEVVMFYEINKDKVLEDNPESATITITLYEIDCMTPVPTNSVEIMNAGTVITTSVNSNVPTVSDIDNLTLYQVELNIFEGTITDTTLWNTQLDDEGEVEQESDNNDDGYIQFCVLTELIHTGLDESVSFQYTKITIPIKLSVDFNIQSFNAIAAAEDLAQQNANVGYQLDACRCDDTNVCNISDDEKVKANTAIRLCIVTLSNEVIIKNVVTFNLIQNNKLIRSPIQNGIVDDLSSASTANGQAQLVTRLTTAFFNYDNDTPPPDITADGIIELDFNNNNNNRRHLQLTNGRPLGRFNITIPIEASSSVYYGVTSLFSTILITLASTMMFLL